MFCGLLVSSLGPLLPSYTIFLHKLVAAVQYAKGTIMAASFPTCTQKETDARRATVEGPTDLKKGSSHWRLENRRGLGLGRGVVHVNCTSKNC